MRGQYWPERSSWTWKSVLNVYNQEGSMSLPIMTTWSRNEEIGSRNDGQEVSAITQCSDFLSVLCDCKKAKFKIFLSLLVFNVQFILVATVWEEKCVLFWGFFFRRGWRSLTRGVSAMLSSRFFQEETKTWKVCGCKANWKSKGFVNTDLIS